MTAPRSPLHAILARSHFSPRTQASYARVIDRWLAFAGDDPAGWTRPRMQAFYDHVLASGVTPASANVYLASLRYVSKWWASQTGAVDFAVAQTAAVRAEPAAPMALTEAQAQRLLLTVDGPAAGQPLKLRDRALLVLGLETGMRRMSLRAARWEALQGTTLTVPIKGAGGLRTYAVPVSDVALGVLAQWRAWVGTRATPAMFPALQRALRPDGQFTWAATGPLAESGVYQIIKHRGAEAGLPNLHPHTLRHTFITWREAAGLTPIQIASITGHKTFGDEWRNMRPYIDLTATAEQARNSTPTWLRALVARWA